MDELLLENDDLLKSPDRNPSKQTTNSGGQRGGTDDSFDIENSDELNKIISKYEMQINQTSSASKKKTTELAESLDDEQIEIEKQLQDDYDFDGEDCDDIDEEEIIDELEI